MADLGQLHAEGGGHLVGACTAFLTSIRFLFRMSDTSRVCENRCLFMFYDPFPPPKQTLVGAGQREMACSGDSSILGLGSYLEFLQLFSAKSSGLRGRGPVFNTNSLTLSKSLSSLALPSSSDE